MQWGSSSVKMVDLLASCTKDEQHSVIRFLSSEGVKPIEIHLQMKVQNGDACLSLQQVYQCTRKFMNGSSSVTDSPRPGQAHPVVTPVGIAAVEAIVKENRHVTGNEIAAHLDMSRGSAHHIGRDKKFKKKCFHLKRPRVYHTSIFLYNINSYMFRHFYVIIREFYICALPRHINS